METVKIAVVESDTSPLAEDLRRLPSRPEVRQFLDPLADARAVADYQPEVIFARLPQDDPESRGAVRALLQLLDGAATVLVGTADQEVALAPLAAGCRAGILLEPYRTRDLTAALLRARSGSDRPAEEVFLDIARGFADEIGNPLMYLSGYLQLLGQGFHPEHEKDRIDQLEAARRGVERIAATIEKVRLLSRVTAVRDPETPVDMLALLQAAVERGAGFPVELPETGAARVLGYEPALRAAVDALLDLGREFANAGCQARLRAECGEEQLRLGLEVHGQALEEWHLPRTYEPYYVARVLRGTPHGLGLFLMQTVVHAHGGEALARRMENGALVMDLVLPLA